MSYFVVITGASGFLGTALTDYLLSVRSDLEILHLSRNRSAVYSEHPRVKWYDISKISCLRKDIGSLPNVIFHLAANGAVQACEEKPRDAIRANVLLTRQVVDFASFCGAKVIYSSTDLVFDGNIDCLSGGYTEQDMPIPRGVYPRTKRRAEILTLAALADSCVVRLSLLYGMAANRFPGTLGWMLKSCAQGQPITMYSDEYRAPLFVLDAARLLWLVYLNNLVGVYHAAGPRQVSRVDYGYEFVKAFGYSKNLVRGALRPQVSHGFQRPANVSLCGDKLCNILSYKCLDITAGMELAAQACNSYSVL